MAAKPLLNKRIRLAIAGSCLLVTPFQFSFGNDKLYPSSALNIGLKPEVQPGPKLPAAPPFNPPPLQPALLDFVTGMPVSYTMKKMVTPRLLRPPFAGAPTTDPKGLASAIKANQLDANKRIKAIKFLAKQDCITWKQSQQVMMQAVLHDPVEEVRYHAALGLQNQLANAADEKPNGKDCRRRDICIGCCNKDVATVLNQVAYGIDELTTCPAEPSARVREVAAAALEICCGGYIGEAPEPTPADPNNPLAPPVTEPVEPDPNQAGGTVKPEDPNKPVAPGEDDPTVVPEKNPLKPSEDSPTPPPDNQPLKPGEDASTPPPITFPQSKAKIPIDRGSAIQRELERLHKKNGTTPVPLPAGGGSEQSSNDGTISQPASLPKTKSEPGVASLDGQNSPAGKLTTKNEGLPQKEDYFTGDERQAGGFTNQRNPSITRTSQAIPGIASLHRDTTITMNGNCVVTMLLDGNLVGGKRQFSSSYGGRIYLFANADLKKAFDANPRKFSPANGGFDPIRSVHDDKFVEGEIPCVHAGRLYLFENQNSLEQFKDDPTYYLDQLN